MHDTLTTRPIPAGKEYTNADSRYATRDSFVVAMEAVTAFVEGPGCYAAVYGMLFQRPWVSAVQILVSTGQLYGTVLYFVTSLLEGGPFCVARRAIGKFTVRCRFCFWADSATHLAQDAKIRVLSGGTFGSTSCS